MTLVSSAIAGGGPENLALIVNQNSDSSKLIANHYVQLRNIPASNVIYLDDVPVGEETNYDEFRDRILEPIIARIVERKIEHQIDYIVYSSDFPTAIRIDRLQQKMLSSTSGVNTRLFNPVASINALTYFAREIRVENYNLLSLQSNRYFRGDNARLLSHPFRGALQVKFQQALAQTIKGNHEEAIERLLELESKEPFQLAIPYWLARVYAAKNDAERTAKWLQQAVKLGWSYRRYTKADRAFHSVRANPNFDQVVQTIPTESFRRLPSQGFCSRYRWAPNGMVNLGDDQGYTMVLSTVLAATRFEGNSEQEAINQITRSVNADHTNPKGTFYFCETSDIRTKTRKDGITQAMDELRRLGHKVALVKGTLPRNKSDIVGLTLGSAGYSFGETRSRIIAGAICENLTSFGGKLLNSSQTTLSELLRYGAAGSSGTVVEPYALQAKFPHPRIHVHYANGCSLAESFYQSVHGPFQLLIVGDALCQPWAKPPTMTVTGIANGDTIKEAKIVRVDYSNSPVPPRGSLIFIDGVYVKTISPKGSFKMVPEDFSDGHHELRVVAVADNAVAAQSNQIVEFDVIKDHLEVALSSPTGAIGFGDTFELKATANFEGKIELMQNRRVIDSIDGPIANFSVKAKELGRGPVRLTARIANGNKFVASKPVQINVLGKINMRPMNTATPSTIENLNE